MELISSFTTITGTERLLTRTTFVNTTKPVLAPNRMKFRAEIVVWDGSNLGWQQSDEA